MARDGDPPRPPGGPTRKLSLHSTRIEIARGASEIAVDDFVDSALSERPQTVPELPLPQAASPRPGATAPRPAGYAPRPAVAAPQPRETRPGIGELDEPTVPEAAPRGSEARRLLDDKERRIRELEMELARTKRELDQAQPPQVTVHEEAWDDDDDDPRTRAVSHTDMLAVKPVAPAAAAAPAWRRAEPPVRSTSQPSMPAVLMRPEPAAPVGGQPTHPTPQRAPAGPTHTVRMTAMQPPIPRTDVVTPAAGIQGLSRQVSQADDTPQPTMVLSSVGASPIENLLVSELAAHPPFEAPSLPPIQAAQPRPVQLAASVPPARSARARDAGDSTAIPVVLSSEPAAAHVEEVVGAAVVAPPPYEAPAPVGAPPAPRRRSRAPWVALGGLVLLGGGVGAAALFGLGPFGSTTVDAEKTSSRSPETDVPSEVATATPTATTAVAPSAAPTAAPVVVAPPPEASASASPAAPSASATASAPPPAPVASASAAPPSPASPSGASTSSPEELAALLSFQGYLTVTAPIDAEVVVQGVSAGRTNQRLLVRCGPRNVRLRDAGGVWRSAGDHAQINCMQHTTVAIAPTP